MRDNVRILFLVLHAVPITALSPVSARCNIKLQYYLSTHPWSAIMFAAQQKMDSQF